MTSKGEEKMTPKFPKIDNWQQQQQQEQQQQLEQQNQRKPETVGKEIQNLPRVSGI